MGTRFRKRSCAKNDAGNECHACPLRSHHSARIRPRLARRRRRPCPCRPLRGRAGGLHHRRFQRHRRCRQRGRRQRQSAGGAVDRSAARLAAVVQRQGKEGLHQDQGRRAARRRDRQAGRRRCPRRYRSGPPQQPAARRRRRRGRRADADGLRSQPALRRGPGGVQIARGRRAAGARQGARRGNQRAREKGDDRSARRHRRDRPRTAARPTRSPPSRSSATAATRTRSA